jgi:hypothetical protein
MIWGEGGKIISHQVPKLYLKLIYYFRNLTVNNFAGGYVLVAKFIHSQSSSLSLIIKTFFINEGISVNITIKNN